MAKKDEKIFGTDGIRGVANVYPMTAEVALKVGRAVARYFKGKAQRWGQNSVVLIGKDTRRSSYMIEQALAAGVTSEGAYALLVGPMPTPGVAFLAKSMRADAGIMVSASHNSFEYNGIKIFGPDSFKLDDETQNKIEDMILGNELDEESSLPLNENLGRAKRIDDAVGRYIVQSKLAFPEGEDLQGYKIVLDPAHGAAYKIAPFIFEELGAEVIKHGIEPNGLNINDGVGALYPEAAGALVKEHKADIGISLDGDADRVILTDENGDVVDGDQLLAILALHLKSLNKLNKDTLVATPMSNMGLELALKERGIKVVYADVGDRAVVNLMKKEGYNLGGEQSGHLVFLDVTTTGDGVIAALSVLAVMKKSGKKLSELRQVVKPLPQLLKNIKVKQKPELSSIDGYQKIYDQNLAKMNGRGRIFVRYSGTEPLCRVMAEHEDAVLLEQITNELVDFLKTKIA